MLLFVGYLSGWMLAWGKSRLSIFLPKVPIQVEIDPVHCVHLGILQELVMGQSAFSFLK
jgi:hypothetical protein